MDRPDTGMEPTCPRHPGVVSYVRCQRCGRPACPDCQRTAAVGIHCVDCVKASRQKQRPVRSGLGLPVAQGKPIVTYTLIGLNLAVYFLGPALWGEYWTGRLSLVPALGLDYEPWRLVTSGFVHFGFAHLLLNMFALFQFGTVVETLLGRLRFGLVYGLSLLGGGLTVLALGQPYSQHGGASGAIFGVLAAFVVLSIALKRPAYDIMVLGGLWLALGFVIEGVSWEGHLGGAVVGAVSALVIVRLGQRSRARGRRR
ncbi:MAG: rhomboid family intramembrane serine protease [Demequinaceae bacterium]|nr:rhomboid family intramembrane serine protease [Demequinaceae bacterium]